MEPTGVFVAGAINTDLVVRVHRAPEAGETVTGTAFDVFGGGKGANQALAAARSGAPTVMLGAVGSDDFGRQRLDDLSKDRVDISGVLVTDKPLPESRSSSSMTEAKIGSRTFLERLPRSTPRTRWQC